MDITKIYQYALQREKEGKRFFEENAARLNHAAAVGAFNTLAAEEQKHIEFIQRQLDRGIRTYWEIFFNIDGAKGLYKGIKTSFVEKAWIQRYQWNMRQNVLIYLSQE